MNFNATFATSAEAFDTTFELSISTNPAENYEGTYVVTPLADVEQTLETNGKIMTDDVTVKKVPSYGVSNDYGTTLTIGGIL